VGIVDKLIAKYRGKADLFCDNVRIVENDAPDSNHQMIGENCSVKVAGMTFTWDKVRTNCNNVVSECKIKQYDPELMQYNFELKGI